jgi:3-oxoacyl-[acyl-carrier protein] reductase
MKRALVTGASGVLGRAIATQLARDGHHVYVHSHTAQARAEEIAAGIVASGGSAKTVSFDVANSAAVNTALQDMLSEGAIQILVNNAGIHDDAVMPGMTPEQWTRVIDVSLNGFFNVTQPLLMPMMRTRWGRIVNISSISALLPTRGQANYAAAKAGMNAATRSLAVELASRGITVNAVAPGIIDSVMSAETFDSAAIERLVPMKRAGKPEEVADLVGFLVSDRAAYISGQIVSINGAMI